MWLRNSRKKCGQRRIVRSPAFRRNRAFASKPPFRLKAGLRTYFFSSVFGASGFFSSVFGFSKINSSPFGVRTGWSFFGSTGGPTGGVGSGFFSGVVGLMFNSLLIVGPTGSFVPMSLILN